MSPPRARDMLTEWPPTDLGGVGMHILVTIGDPYSPRLQRRKLESLLNRVPTGDAWRVYAPDVFYMGGCCGAVFSTADRAAFQREMQAVRDIRHGVRGGNGRGVHRGSSFSDPTAYTDLQVIDVDASVEEASAALDRAFEEQEAARKAQEEHDQAARKAQEEHDEAARKAREEEEAEGERPKKRSKAAADSGATEKTGATGVGGMVKKSTVLVLLETLSGVRYRYEVPSSFDLGERPIGRDGGSQWVVEEGEKSLLKQYLGRVYDGHLVWLRSRSQVCRSAWKEHLDTYDKDKNVGAKTREGFLSALRIAYLAGERHRYGLPAGRKHGGGITEEVFRRELSAAVEEHLEQVRREEMMDGDRLFRLLRLYDGDPLMPGEMHGRLYTAALIRHERWISVPLPQHVQEQLDTCERQWREIHGMLMHSMHVPDTIEGLGRQDRRLTKKWWEVGDPPSPTWPTSPTGEGDSGDDDGDDG